MSRNKQNIKAIFTDLDGTLLGPDHKISDAALKMLQRIRTEYNNEIPFIVATGRPYGDVFRTLKDCQLEADYIVTSNGGRIHDRDKQLVSKTNLDVNFLRALLAEAHEAAGKPFPGEEPATKKEGEGGEKEKKAGKYSLDFLQGRQFAISIFREADWLLDLEVPGIREAYHPEFRWDVKGVGGLCDLTDEDLEGTHELYFIGPPNHLHAFDDAVMKHHYITEGKCTCTFPTPYTLDCVPPGIGKGKALEKVATLLGISPKDVAAFGDGMNDETMLRTAGHPYIMQNANPALKEALPHVPVIGSNKEDGVIQQLQALLF